MKEQNLGELGDAVDTLSNLLAAMKLPLPPQLHIDGLTASLPRLRDKLRDVYVSESGENPWA